MRRVAENVWLLPGFANVYLVGDVLLDAGTPWDAGRILARLRGRKVTAHALTHAHPDHLGASHAVCSALRIPYLVGERDAATAEEPGLLARQFMPRLPRTPISNLVLRVSSGPGHPVARALREGDEVAGFEVLDMPGHTPGHIALWRAADRVLIAGDVIWNIDLLRGRPGLTQPFDAANSDTAALRDSIRRAAALEPAVLCFGHGPPLRDPDRLARFAASL